VVVSFIGGENHQPVAQTLNMLIISTCNFHLSLHIAVSFRWNQQACSQDFSCGV